jgi:hypothetical protein
MIRFEALWSLRVQVFSSNRDYNVVAILTVQRHSYRQVLLEHHKPKVLPQASSKQLQVLGYQNYQTRCLRRLKWKPSTIIIDTLW